MLEGTDHDAVDIAGEDTSSVAQGLAAAELHFLAGQRDGLSAELTHGDVEGYPRARRGLVEDHRERLAGKRRFGRAAVTLEPLLNGAARVDHAAQRLRRHVDE